MEKKYRDAIFTGLKCGAVIAIVYLIFNIAGLWLKSTPAMKPFINDLMQSSATPYIGQPPMEYYIIAILDVVFLAAMVIGFLATGLFAIRSEKLQKYTTNYIVSIGSIAGIAAFIPFFIAALIVPILTAEVMGPAWSEYSPDIPGYIFGITFCFCLSIGIILSAILSAAGAWGYAHFTKRIKSAF